VFEVKLSLTDGLWWHDMAGGVPLKRIGDTKL
jgi:hypothetical protein